MALSYIMLYNLEESIHKAEWDDDYIKWVLHK